MNFIQQISSKWGQGEEVKNLKILRTSYLEAPIMKFVIIIFSFTCTQLLGEQTCDKLPSVLVSRLALRPGDVDGGGRGEHEGQEQVGRLQGREVGAVRGGEAHELVPGGEATALANWLIRTTG